MIKLVKEVFEDYKCAFQVVAFQAVVAHHSGRDTNHHACGVPAHKKGLGSDSVEASRMDMSKRVLQRRWLIIDVV